MIRGIYLTGKHMLSRQKNIEMTANNLANVNTTGYKREVPFSEILSRIDNQPELQMTDFSDGTLVKTENPLDLAVSGQGFFIVQTPNGPLLTKNGKFKIADDGFLVNEDGYKVMGKGGDINILDSVLEKNKEFKINKNGDIQVGDEVVGQLMIAKIDDQSAMVRASGTQFLFPDEGFSFASESEFEVHQGFIEESNVNPVMEMQNMITINRDYEASQKIINSLDNILGRLQEIGRV